MYFHLLIGIIVIALCWKWGDWRNWKSYYPTILYFIIGDLTAYILLHNKPLWLYEGYSYNYFFLDLYYATIVYPCMIILFLTYYPDKIKRQMAYLIWCVAIFTSFEYMLYIVGLFSYYNGWSIKHSAVFDLFMFMLLRLHFKKSLFVWPISVVLAFVVLFLYNIPIVDL